MLNMIADLKKKNGEAIWMTYQWIEFGYLISTALFIFGLKKLGHPRLHLCINMYGMAGMAVAVVYTSINSFRQ